jgi:hypothetical protein
MDRSLHAPHLHLKRFPLFEVKIVGLDGDVFGLGRVTVGYADFYQVLGGHLLVDEGELLAVVKGDVVEF